MKPRTLPLGVDIGTARLRVALIETRAQGVRLVAVAARDLPTMEADVPTVVQNQQIASLLGEALEELGTRERRCVGALGEPDAVLRPVSFPKMTSIERGQAARFEAQRHAEYPIEEAIVRTHPTGESGRVFALGIARKDALQGRVATLRQAGLRPLSVDHESCALGRVFSEHDAVVDVGWHRTSIHVYPGNVPLTVLHCAGGNEITHGIARDLAIDLPSAEKRKRILGVIGGGESARATLARDVAAALQLTRAGKGVTRVALVGNGARIAGLKAEIESLTGAIVQTPVGDAMQGGAYPDDVLRAGAPDWSVAVGLALWGRQAA